MSIHYYILIAISFILGTIAFLFQAKILLFGILIIFWVLLLAFSLMKIDRRIALCSFVVTFFAFLLGRIFIDFLLPGFESDYTFEVANRDKYSNEASYFVLYTLILSLVGLSIGYLSANRKQCISNYYENPQYLKRVRIIAKKLTFLFFIFALLVTIEKIIYIWTNGYVDFYLTYTESLPHICYTLAASYKFSFFIFLATIPSKKEAKPLIILYLLDACISLLTGQRGAFITPLLFIIIYFFIRNSLSPEDLWIGKKGKFAILVTIPVLCASMFVVMLIRGNDESGDFDLLTLFLNFFYQLGGSETVIGYSYDLKSVMPEDQWYSLGPLIRFFKSNPIALLFGFDEKIQFQSVEMATKGHELGSFLTYQTDSYRYLSGGNLASSYVAELWLDFGFVGIVVGNIIYGRILASLSFLSRPNIWKTTVVLIMINRIITAPRASFAFFITDCLSFSFILMILYMLRRCKGIPHYISVR